MFTYINLESIVIYALLITIVVNSIMVSLTYKYAHAIYKGLKKRDLIGMSTHYYYKHD